MRTAGGRWKQSLVFSSFQDERLFACMMGGGARGDFFFWPHRTFFCKSRAGKNRADGKNTAHTILFFNGNNW